MNGPTLRTGLHGEVQNKVLDKGHDTWPATGELEIDLLLEALFQGFGFDFRSYERGAIRDKIHAGMAAHGVATVSQLQDRVLHDGEVSAALLRALSVQPAQLFDMPEQSRLLRIVLSSCLRASAVPKVWLAECAGAEQAWSLAILLCEEELHHRTEIYATLANEDMLADVADAGIPVERMQECSERYVQAGGSGNLMDYFDVVDGRAVLLPALRERITWAQYNLVTDASFNEFQVIVCQRALRDFGPLLRGRTLRLFHESLSLFGIIGIDREMDGNDPLGVCYQPVFAHQAWYKRIG